MKYLFLLVAMCLVVGCKPEPTPAPPVINLGVPAPVPVAPAPVKTEYLAFTMLNCDPCHQMKAEWKKVGAKVYNVHRYPVLAQKYNITQCPTTIVIEDGKENVAKRVVGYQAL